MEGYQALAATASRIDRAAYTHPDAYFDAVDPEIGLAKALPRLSEGQKTDIIRRLVTEPDLSSVLRAYGTEVAVAVVRDRDTLAQAQRVTELRDAVAITDLTGGLPFVRFASYVYYPSARYALTVFRVGDGVRVSLSKNPWISFSHKDLGALVALEGVGGGHSYAASALFTGPAPDASAWAFVARVVRTLNDTAVDASPEAA
jgi:hypothetical protein